VSLIEESAGYASRCRPIAPPWQATLKTAARDSTAAVLVSAEPRLIDLLRHPEEETDRSDLMLSTG
jgi:hypothetical protein